MSRIKHHTHRFVRHQYNWFRLNDVAICWFDVLGDPYGEIRGFVASFLKMRCPNLKVLEEG